MKKNIFKIASLLALVSFTMTSCDEWLTVYPQTQIVEENFWEDKNDLEGVRYAAYKNMASQVDKMIIWGDLRSDIYKLPEMVTSSQGNRDNFYNIIYANIDKYDARVSVCAGATVDFLAGNVERAPKWMSDHGLEWFYRLMKQPSRLGRMMKLPLFLLHVAAAKGKKR